jgi:hypothetical protein
MEQWLQQLALSSSTLQKSLARMKPISHSSFWREHWAIYLEVHSSNKSPKDTNIMSFMLFSLLSAGYL